jgi:signal transduction histidine kinase
VRSAGDGAPVPLEFEVRASPLNIDGGDFTLLLLSNAGDKRRRLFYEGYFLDQLRDLLLELGAMAQTFSDRADAARLDTLVNRVSSLVKDQRVLLAAERGTLEPQREKINVAAFVADILQLAGSFAWSQGRELAAEPVVASEQLVTDGELATRVLIQMVENACEAVEPGASVTFAYERRGDVAAFSVHNPGFIPEPIAARIFDSAFTTKSGPGRGLGAYAMKLLAERYLGGSVTFTTDPAAGTRFVLQLPRRSRIGRRERPAR